ncbi:hypothetical protein GCM10011492_27180 [Flexivirga endophytica]|uniref:Uncharacterized protein n=1 Tax=Flexivirga endophytica TaxID=1849103 RepID=A0A916WWD7_9MICO|nr:hypothetical protein GCM10011492_27180 [Flexivirga endophytica]GHB42921.1 hypothetical protein GCM10008112_09560 [Flexivirga endophytica]
MATGSTADIPVASNMPDMTLASTTDEIPNEISPSGNGSPTELAAAGAASGVAVVSMSASDIEVLQLGVGTQTGSVG